ncbi:hypothetical protein FRC10_010736 [Ceratobasidium sp. 414]|nr:hypothetical protein FRC10_010736 [Ceratobasidium sp. 414]
MPPPQLPKTTQTVPPSAATATSTPPLTLFDMGMAAIKVPRTHIRVNQYGKEVSSFTIEVMLHPSANREEWKVEKLYSDVVALDIKIRQLLGRSALKEIAPLPEGKLFKNIAPSKVDQQKRMLQVYLQTVLQAPWEDVTEVAPFFTSDVVSEALGPSPRPRFKEGYLTKQGKNFGGWKTRYFVLQSPVLEYYRSVSVVYINEQRVD